MGVNHKYATVTCAQDMPRGRQAKLTPEQQAAMIRDIEGGLTHTEAAARYGIDRRTVDRILARAPPVQETQPQPADPDTPQAILEEELDTASRERDEARAALKAQQATQGKEPQAAAPKGQPQKPKSKMAISAESLIAAVDNKQTREILDQTSKITAGNIDQMLISGARLIYDFWPQAQAQGYSEGQVGRWLEDMVHFWLEWHTRIAEYEQEANKVRAYDEMVSYTAIMSLRGLMPDPVLLLAQLATPDVRLTDMITQVGRFSR